MITLGPLLTLKKVVSLRMLVHDIMEVMMGAAAVERVVVQVTPKEKKAITAKAKRLGLPISELMRRGATAYEPDEADEELGLFADKAKSAADRASESVDNVRSFVEASNARIAAMEAKAFSLRKGF